MTLMKTGTYQNYISLGYFCSVAMELERTGLRSASYPFDWLITPRMENVIRMIETGFDSFLDEQSLVKDPLVGTTYVHVDTGFSFVHDFKADGELSDLLPGVKCKYERRIERFYQDITKPTLFIRYINDEDPDDPAWTMANQRHILEVLRSYNPDNDIIWIANSTLTSELNLSASAPVYFVDKDEGDSVARRPLDKNRDLYDLLMNADYEGRSENIRIYKRKTRKRNGIYARIMRKLSKIRKPD